MHGDLDKDLPFEEHSLNNLHHVNSAPYLHFNTSLNQNETNYAGTLEKNSLNFNASQLKASSSHIYYVSSLLPDRNNMSLPCQDTEPVDQDELKINRYKNCNQCNLNKSNYKPTISNKSPIDSLWLNTINTLNSLQFKYMLNERNKNIYLNYKENKDNLFNLNSSQNKSTILNKNYNNSLSLDAFITSRYSDSFFNVNKQSTFKYINNRDNTVNKCYKNTTQSRSTILLAKCLRSKSHENNINESKNNSTIFNSSIVASSQIKKNIKNTTHDKKESKTLIQPSLSKNNSKIETDNLLQNAALNTSQEQIIYDNEAHSPSLYSSPTLSPSKSSNQEQNATRIIYDDETQNPSLNSSQNIVLEKSSNQQQNTAQSTPQKPSILDKPLTRNSDDHQVKRFIKSRINFRLASSSSVSSSTSSSEFWEEQYGIIIVLASFLVHFLCDGCGFSFGVLFVHLLDEFGEGRWVTSWIGSLLVAIPAILGPLASILTNKYGCRRTTIAGGLITFTGCFLSAFAPSAAVICVTFGLMTGLGMALTFVPAIVIVSFHFEKNRALATGIAVSGSGTGTFVFAPLTDFLLREYNWRGTFIILSAIFLHLVVCGVLFRTTNQVPHKIESSFALSSYSTRRSDNSLGSLTPSLRTPSLLSNHAYPPAPSLPPQPFLEGFAEDEVVPVTQSLVVLPEDAGVDLRRLKSNLTIEIMQSGPSEEQNILERSELRKNYKVMNILARIIRKTEIAEPAVEEVLLKKNEIVLDRNSRLDNVYQVDRISAGLAQQEPIPVSIEKANDNYLVNEFSTKADNKIYTAAKESSKRNADDFKNLEVDDKQLASVDFNKLHKVVDKDDNEKEENRKNNLVNVASRRFRLNFDSNIFKKQVKRNQTGTTKTVKLTKVSSDADFNKDNRERNNANKEKILIDYPLTNNKNNSVDKSNNKQVNTTALIDKNDSKHDIIVNKTALSLSNSSIQTLQQNESSDIVNAQQEDIAALKTKETSQLDEANRQYIHTRKQIDKTTISTDKISAQSMDTALHTSAAKNADQIRSSTNAILKDHNDHNDQNDLILPRHEKTETLKPPGVSRHSATKENATKPILVRKPGKSAAKGKDRLPLYASRYLNNNPRHRAAVLKRRDTLFKGSLLKVSFMLQRSSQRIVPSTLHPESTMVIVKPPLKLRIKFWWRDLREHMDMSFLRSPTFLYICVQNFLLFSMYDIPYVYLIDYVRQYVNINEDIAFWLVSIIGLSSTIGQVIFGLISDRHFVDSLLLYNVSIVLAGICTLLVPQMATFAHAAVYCFFYGLCISSNFALTTVIIVRYLGLQHLVNAFGMVSLAQGFGNLFGPPIAGYIIDTTENYDKAFYMAGSIILASGLMLTFIPYFQWRQLRKQGQKPKRLKILLWFFRHEARLNDNSEAV